jgi:hypothetical protein
VTNAHGKTRHIILAAVLSVGLIVAIGALTNSLDIQNFSWDFRYYIAMAQDGFKAPLASPFAYRYLTPLFVYGITHTFGISIEDGFRSIAYLGAFLQLIGVFLFTNWFTRSIKGAYTALVITAFSLFNVKFLLFDIYRPDHLAYVLMLLQSYFAFERRFLPLLVTTLIGLQIREFNLIPLVVYLLTFARGKDRTTFIREAALSAVGLAAAILLPRLLIPVGENLQFADLSRDGILRVLLAPLVLTRDLNFLFSIVAYLLPTLIIAGLKETRAVMQSWPADTRSYFFIYTGLVLMFSFLGGTDFYRFSTYLFLPQAAVLGSLAPRVPNPVVVITGVATFIFNRIWLPFPASDAGAYLDFYGAFGTRLNASSLMRMLECLALIAAGFQLRRLLPIIGPTPARPVHDSQ